MGRNPCCSKEGMNRGAWTALEDQILTDYVKIHGEGKWRNIPKQAGLKRCGKSCRLRWLNYLRPDIKRGNISKDEEDLIIRLHKLLGNRWSLIAGRLPGRTDNEIKNYWNTNLSKRTQGKQSNQQKNESKQPIRPFGSPNLGMFRANSSKHTRALVKDPQEDQSIGEFNDTINVAAAAAGGTNNGLSMDYPNPVMIKNEAATAHDHQLSESSEDGSSILFTCDDKILSDFEMDFDMGEIFLSENLDPEFSKLGDFNFHEFTNIMEGGHGGTNNNGSCYQTENSPFSDQQLFTSEEMVKNYAQANGMDSEFRCLASCFEPAAVVHEWVEDDLVIV